jgi:hypothetical protein
VQQVRDGQPRDARTYDRDSHVRSIPGSSSRRNVRIIRKRNSLLNYDLRAV